MLRHHPYLTAAGAVYFVGVCAISLSQTPSTMLSFPMLVLLFAPAGALLTVLLRPERWLFALFIGTLCIMWIELACIVWNSQASGGPEELMARLFGLAIGVAVTASVLLATKRRHEHENSPFTRVSQARESGLRAERRHD